MQRSNTVINNVDYNEGTFDAHEKGVWRGYVRVIDLSGELDLKKTVIHYLDINQDRATLELKQTTAKHIESIPITYIEMLCKSLGPCSAKDYAHHKNQDHLLAQADKQV